MRDVSHADWFLGERGSPGRVASAGWRGRG